MIRWMYRCFLISGLAGFVLLTGCMPLSTSTSDDPFVREILLAYPELQGKLAESDTITRVVDGDTFELSSGAKVRMIGVDTPEVYGGAEPYGLEASDFSKELLNDKEVVMFKDVSTTDRYGRLLRYVFLLGDPLMVNERLIVEGYANAMTYPPDVSYAERFVEAERTAREQSLGMWQETPAAAASCDSPQIKGNINSKGEKIYHLPDGRYYEATIAEMMFCTEEEAVQSGFRAVKR